MPTYPRPSFVDGPYKFPKPVTLPKFSTTLPNSTNRCILAQEFDQFLVNYIPMVYGTKHPDYPDYVLVNESELQDLTGGMVRWTRTYARVPDSYSDFEMFPAQFVGMAGGSFGVNVPVTPSRSPFSERVKSRVQYDFFLVGSTATPAAGDYGPGVDDANAGADNAGTVAAPIDTAGNVPKVWPFYFVSQVYYLARWYGGIYWIIASLNDNSMPSFTQYLRMIDDAQANGWGSTVSEQFFTDQGVGQVIINPASDDAHSATPTPNSVFGGQISAEESRLDRWMGPIYMRKSRYILAQ